jgi:hypothetical protein
VSITSRENKLRRELAVNGYRLMKSRARNANQITFEGYQIADVATGGLVAGWGNAGMGFAFSLADVADWLGPDERSTAVRGNAVSG